jgi:hypothetical protein
LLTEYESDTQRSCQQHHCMPPVPLTPIQRLGNSVVERIDLLGYLCARMLDFSFCLCDGLEPEVRGIS